MAAAGVPSWTPGSPALQPGCVGEEQPPYPAASSPAAAAPPGAAPDLPSRSGAGGSPSLLAPSVQRPHGWEEG